MKRTCRRLQRILAEHGPTALADDEAAQDHLADCGDCFAVLEGMAELDAALAELPVHDPPDELVESLLVRPELLEWPLPAAPESRLTVLWSYVRRSLPGRRWQWATAAAAVLTAIGAVVLWTMSLRHGETPLFDHASVRVPPASVPSGQSQEESEEPREDLRALGYIGDSPQEEAAAPIAPSRPMAPPPPPAPPRQSEPPPDRARAGKPTDTGDQALDLELGESITVIGEVIQPEPRRISTGMALTPANEGPPADLDPWAVLGTMTEGRAYQDHVDQEERRTSQVAGSDAEGGEEADSADGDGASDLSPRQRARDFLRGRASLDGLRFQPAEGYWSNTYVPGDPALRDLQAWLTDSDRSVLQAHAKSELRLHDGARRIAQPFDPPANAALAVFLHSDRRRIRGETRMLVQVGLKGSERRGGRRPPMNVSVVLDAGGEVPAEAAASLRALIAAFGQAREPGDRFRLVVAGRPGGLAVPPGEFRHGRLTLAVAQALGDGEALDGPTLDLPAALGRAVLEASGDDDPATPLAASAVVLATSRTLDDDFDAVRRLAHRSAVAGVPVSVVGVGDGVDLEELEELALAGQGNRRRLLAAGEAPDLVERELSSAARVVARAVRLSIRLARGVRLVDVVGSHRLEPQRADEVREAERAIDQRLARDLGIAADRGEDEDGIQIVIPSFYAGDAHVVLLDVVAPGPGKVADVRVRYKDLVYLENGQARARLSVRRGDLDEGALWEGGPLERNVLKNLLAWRLREVLEQAVASLEEVEEDLARQQLADFLGLLEGLALEIPGLAQDADHARDLAFLGEYVELLGTVEDFGGLVLLEDSMRYAALLKTLPPPTPVADPP